jgi:methyltransferase
VSWGLAQIVVGLVLLQRLAELHLARRNAAALLAAGGVEHGAEHYPWVVALHALWLTALALAVGPESAVDPWLLGAFLALQPLRVWTLASLGRFWTTRVIVLPGAAPVARGPYRWLRHPNYAIVALELALLPLALGLVWLALAATLANAALMRVRLRVENAALAAAAATAPSSPRRW